MNAIKQALALVQTSTTTPTAAIRRLAPRLSARQVRKLIRYRAHGARVVHGQILPPMRVDPVTGRHQRAWRIDWPLAPR